MRITARTVALYALPATPDQEDQWTELLDEALEAAVLCFYAEIAERFPDRKGCEVTIGGVTIEPAPDLADCTRRLYPEPEPVESF
jgi:hypothetical protein